MHVPPQPGLPSNIQSHWQGPFIVVKCFQGNTYCIKQANNFSKRFLQYCDLLHLFCPHPVCLCSSQNVSSIKSAYKFQIWYILYYVHLTTARCWTFPTQLFSQQKIPAFRIDIPPREAEGCTEQTHRSDRQRLHHPKSVSAPSLTLRRGIRSCCRPDIWRVGNEPFVWWWWQCSHFRSPVP